MILSHRIIPALRVGFYHLLASLTVALVVAGIVFGIWYAWPFYEMVSGREFFWLIVAVDIVCGPLLTIILWNPKKPTRELALDLSIVVFIQLSALGYGLYTVANARPVYLVFEVDRFRLVTASEIEIHELSSAPKHLQDLPWLGPKTISVRAPKNTEELLKSIDLSLIGKEPSLRPNWWQNYEISRFEALKAAKNFSIIENKYPAQENILKEAVKKSGLSSDQLSWLPLVSGKNMNWIIFLDKKTGEPRAFAPIDGFF